MATTFDAPRGITKKTVAPDHTGAALRRPHIQSAQTHMPQALEQGDIAAGHVFTIIYQKGNTHKYML